MRPRSAVGVLTVLVLLLSALSLGLALTRPDRDLAVDPPGGSGAYRPAALAGPAGPALAAAVETLPLALTYDHRTLAAGLEAATAGMTDRYAARFRREFDRTTRAQAQRDRLVTGASVRGAGVSRTVGERRVVCLLYVDRLLVSDRSSAPGAGPRLSGRSRVVVSVVRRGEAWLVDDIRRL